MAEATAPQPVFAGAKVLIAQVWRASIAVSLGVIVAILAVFGASITAWLVATPTTADSVRAAVVPGTIGRP